MKQSEVKHILDTTSEVEPEEKQLVFTASIYPFTGGRGNNILYQPSDWDNVKHLTGNLYYAYGNNTEDNPDNSIQGTVYVGEFK